MPQNLVESVVREMKYEIANPDLNIHSKCSVFLALSIFGQLDVLDGCVKDHLNSSTLDQFYQLKAENDCIYLQHLLRVNYL